MRDPIHELQAFARASLWDRVPYDDRVSAAELRRRRIVAGITLFVGMALLGWSLRIEPGNPLFYLTTLLLAAVWAVGAFLSGPLHAGHAWTRSGSTARPVVQSLALAAALVLLFCAGAIVVARVPFLRGPVDALLDHARYGSLPLVAALTAINGVGEELYFRGGLFAAFPQRYAVAATTLLYTLTTVASGVPLLVLAAAVLGLVTGMQRRVTGGVLGPIIVHCGWSLSMLFLLPVLLDRLA